LLRGSELQAGEMRELVAWFGEEIPQVMYIYRREELAGA
jgi:hypothetical protein